MRKIISFIVITILICSFCFFSYAENNTSLNNTTTLQQQHNELKNQIESASSELKDVQEELSNNLQQVQEVDANIEVAQSELDEINIKYDILNKSIQKNRAELKKAKDSYEKEKGLFEERLIAMYEAGDTKYIDVLLQANGISDFLSSYYLLEELALYDTDIIDSLEKKKKTVEEIQETLNIQNKEMLDLQKNQIELTNTLQDAKEKREGYISGLTDQEKQIQEKIDEYTKQFAQVNSEILSLSYANIGEEYTGGELAWPVPGYTRITSSYGMRTHPITGVFKLHTGVDIGAPEGANFIAANDGVVVKAEYNTAYGNMVLISHGGGISTLYAHGSEIVVQLGQIVKRGDIVLKVGSTGYSTGAHAHFEVRKNGTTVDPLPYITKGVLPTQDVSSQQDEEE